MKLTRVLEMLNMAPASMALNTERVVAILRSAGLQADIDTRRTKRGGFRVRQMSRKVVGIDGTTMSDEEWMRGMAALETAGMSFPYRSDQGRGCQITL